MYRLISALIMAILLTIILALVTVSIDEKNKLAVEELHGIVLDHVGNEIVIEVGSKSFFYKLCSSNSIGILQQDYLHKSIVLTLLRDTHHPDECYNVKSVVLSNP